MRAYSDYHDQELKSSSSWNFAVGIREFQGVIAKRKKSFCEIKRYKKCGMLDFSL